MRYPSLRALRPAASASLVAAALTLPASLTVSASAASAAARSVGQARAARSSGPSVSRVLADLESAGAITPAVRAADLAAYAAAKKSLARLHGTRRSELGAVLANLQAIATSGRLDSSRLPVLILTLERNRQWWTSEPMLRSGERVSFAPSKIVWQYYPGQGLQIQWLGTFGAANGLYLSGHENSSLRRLLAEVVPLASRRAGGIAWEYMFRFDGGRPPWTSGLSQGTAIQVLARASARFHEPALLTAAQQALAIFATAPPNGVRVATSAGALYAQYSFAPSDRILNGFIQSLVGLYDYAAIAKDPTGLGLFEAGDAQARAMVPLYDTGAWSLYDQFGESSLNYHELLAEFLQHLCERTRKGPPFVTSPPPTTTTGTTTTTPTGGTGAEAPGGSTSPTTPVAIAGDEIYCTTAERFKTDLTTPPAISLLTTKLTTSSRAGVRVSLSKIATVRLSVTRAGHTVWTNRATVSRGRPRLLWLTPSRPGSYSIALTATDLAGNFQTATGSITLVRRAKRN
jgi:hypothetical protein